MISQIFEYINKSNSNNELFKIDVSIIEIYKEQVNDLIDKKNTNLNIIEQKNKRLLIDNLTHVGVSSEEQLLKVVNKGLLNRTNNTPSFREHNSKSHFIIMITLYQYYKEENYMKIGKLFIVDLEGSERISKNKIPKEPLEEQKLINKSLIALSRIVQNLSNEYDNITYAPYRDSKLTRIISDCFGGNAYTSLILNCSKHECSTIETRNTLMFGEKCKKIKNKPVINVLKYADQSIIMGEIFGLGDINQRVEQNLYNNNIDNNFERYDNPNMNDSPGKFKNKTFDNMRNNSLFMNKTYDRNSNKIDNNRKKSYDNNRRSSFDKNINEDMNLYMNKNINISTEKSRKKSENRKKSSTNKNMNDSLDININTIKSMDKSFNKNKEDENKFLKIQINQLRDKINVDSTNIEQLYKKNLYLENENKNLMEELKLLVDKNNDDELKDKINNFYIKNNINDLHYLLNEKENNEKELINEINSIKILYNNKMKELNDIINQKQLELKNIREKQKDNIKTCKELTDCLNEASNQIKIKEKIIEELIYKNNNNTKENNDLKNTINNLEQEKENIKYKSATNFNQAQDNINNLNDKIKELNNQLKNKENDINNLNKEKIEYLKVKGDYDNKINEMNDAINKMKIELNNKNLSLDNNAHKIKLHQNEIDTLNKIINENNNNSKKLLSENNILKNKID